MRTIILLTVALFSLPTPDAITQTLPGGPVYQAGEMLRFQMYYGPLNAGETVMTLAPVRYENSDVLHAVTLAYTTGLADKLFKVYDVYESFMDPVTGLPYKAIRNISEGNYRFYNEVLYNRENRTVTSQRSGVHEVPPGILDIVSAIYKLRDTINTISLRPGMTIELASWFGDELYPLVIRYNGTETIRTRMGRFHALKFSPVSEPGRMFKTEDDITVWFSNDRNVAPLRVRLNMLVGAVRIDLIEADGLRHPLFNAR